MAYRDLTLGIGDGTATGFSTSIVPPVVLRGWTDYPIRSLYKLKKLSGFSLAGTPLITGEQYGPRYIWGVKKEMSKELCRQLMILFDYQQRTENNLRLIDEVEHLDPELAPHSRTLLEELTEPSAAGYVYGFGVFNVWLDLPDEFRTDYGKTASGVDLKTVKFTMAETTV